MAIVFLIIFATAACSTPGLAQSSAYGDAVATANANAISTGGSATAYSYAYSYPQYEYGEVDCTYDRCTPTCALPVPQNCPERSNPCNCPPGSIISEKGGWCVQEQECPRYINCLGDYNAINVECPSPCRSTCARPNRQDCRITRCTPGCECKDGYILSDTTGQCIKVESCPGPVCNRNQTFLNCLTECPNLYCPVSTSQVACGPSGPPCSGGCACKYGYLRRSVTDHTCILASDCPPGKCYGPNEEWNRCISRCISDTCKDRNKVPVPGDCPFVPADCTPRCLCKKGFYRKGYTCVPANECPPDSQ